MVADVVGDRVPVDVTPAGEDARVRSAGECDRGPTAAPTRAIAVREHGPLPFDDSGRSVDAGSDVRAVVERERDGRSPVVGGTRVGNRMPGRRCSIGTCGEGAVAGYAGVVARRDDVGARGRGACRPAVDALVRTDEIVAAAGHPGKGWKDDLLDAGIRIARVRVDRECAR